MPSVEHIKQKFRAHVPFAMYTDSKKKKFEHDAKKEWTQENANNFQMDQQKC